MTSSPGLEIVVIGSGYVGTTLAASLADAGHRVTAVDIDESVVTTITDGDSPIHEPGVGELIAQHIGDGLWATTNYDVVPNADIVFLAVQTPANADGSVDVSSLAAAAQMTGEAIAATPAEDRPLIVIKSTVTPPQLTTVRSAIEDGTGDEAVEVAMNPEFLREGSAVDDIRHPDKLVFGVENTASADLLMEVFSPLVDESDPTVIRTDPETAAMIKYANNAFLAAKISLINDIGNICKTFGLDAYEVADAIGEDDRIGSQFLRSGVGFGGSCFPKDVRALIQAADEAGYSPAVLQAAMEVNERQPERMLQLLERHLDPAGKRIAVLGLSFKPGTDDIRYSRAIPIIDGLLKRNASIIAYDPVATDRMREEFPDIEYADTAEMALAGASAVLVVTDWPEFSALDDAFDQMERQLVIDGRRIVEPRPGMTYEGLTW